MNDQVKQFPRIIVIIISLLLVGCGGSDGWKARTHKTYGHITINGQPAVDAIIILKAIGDPIDARHSEPWGAVDQDGNYQLTTYKSNDGAPVGLYAITLSWPLNPSSLADRLKGRYSAIETAVAQVEIKSGNNTIPDIKLEGVKLSEATSKREPDDRQEIP